MLLVSVFILVLDFAKADHLCKGFSIFTRFLWCFLNFNYFIFNIPF